MQNARLDEAQAGTKIASRNVNNLSCAESEEELKSLLMRLKEESKKDGLKLNIQKTKIMSSCPITSWQIDGEKNGNTDRLYFLGLQNQHIRKQPTKVFIVKAIVFPVVMYRCES